MRTPISHYVRPALIDRCRPPPYPTVSRVLCPVDCGLCCLCVCAAPTSDLDLSDLSADEIARALAFYNIQRASVRTQNSDTAPRAATTPSLTAASLLSLHSDNSEAPSEGVVPPEAEE